MTVLDSLERSVEVPPPSAVPGGPSRRDRLIVACLIAAAVAALAPLVDAGGDFIQLWGGAGALLHGTDPYSAIGPGKSVPWPWPLYYPVPALLPAIPFTVFPLFVARVVWVAILSGIFAFAITARGWAGLLLCLHLSGLVAIQMGQLSVLLAVALLIPAFGAIAAGKPTTGAAVLIGADTRRDAMTMFIAAAALFLVSFAFEPGWVPRWLASVAHTPHMQPLVTRPWGWLVLVAAVRWRLPAARVLCATALVPTTLSAHDMLPALVALRPTRRESIVLVVLSFLAAPALYAIADNPDRVVYSARLMPRILWAAWIPLVVCILRRPNVGSAPPWLEAVTARLPAWLRGRP
jgi:hypothetical protein